MKNTILGVLVLVALGCGKKPSQETKEVVQRKVEEHNLQEYYFPLSDTMVPTTYTYEVVTASKDKSPEFYYESLTFRRHDDGNYAFTRYDKRNNLIDSLVFTLDQKGANVAGHFIKTENNDFVKADVSPSLMFPWKRELNGRMTNIFKYRSMVNGQLISTSVNVNNGFVGFLPVDNALSNENSCEPGSGCC